MTPAIILSDFRCRHCRRAIPLAFTSSLRGTNLANGYLCPNCIVREQENMQRLRASIDAFNASARYLDIDGIAPPCAICDTIEGDERVLEDVDGEKAFLCKPCANSYLLANRAKIAGTKLEWDLKLR